MLEANERPVGTERFRFEPTVFGAVRRYPLIVMVVAIMGAAVGLGYSVTETKLYRASASVTVPKSESLKDQDPDQYFDSQVLLLESPEVAREAARIADTSLGADVLSERDFRGDDKAMEIVPPEGANPGSYGANTVKIAFTWPDAVVAQVGANAALQAFDIQRSVTIRTQAEAMVAGIERTMVDARARDQLADLVNQRTETLVTEQVDLANHPTIASATEPQAPINANTRNSVALGLLVGAIAGGALAYALALRFTSFDDKLDPAGLYRAPLIGQVALSEARSVRVDGSGAGGMLPMAVPQRLAAEAFRFSAGAIERFHTASGPGRSIAFVSPRTSASRSAVAANIALAMAEGGMRVLAVDVDPAAGLTALLLPGCSARQGVAQVVEGSHSVSACVRPSPWSSSVSVLPFGTPTSERVTARAVIDLVAQVDADFDAVLVDTPALLEVADTAELVRACDTAVVVVNHHERVDPHIDAVRQLDLIEADVAGYLYNREQPRARSSWAGRDGGPTRLAAAATAGPADRVPGAVEVDPAGGGRPENHVDARA